MFKNALVYQIEQWDQPPLLEIEHRLAGSRFLECGASQAESHGFIEPRGEQGGPFLETVGEQLILKLCSETKGVPSGVIKTKLEERLLAIEQQTGRRPRGKQVKEIKEEIVHALLPRAFPKRGSTMIWLDLQAQRLVIGAGSFKKADSIVTRLLELLGGGIRVTSVQTQLSPAVAMAGWLSDKQAPAGFTVDRECELKQPDSEKAAVRYARHSLELDELGEHIKRGKLPTQLAMTWAGRVSFMLTESCAIRKIKLLDVVLESSRGAHDSQQDAAGFTSDVVLTTGELRELLPDLFEALGGLQTLVASTHVVDRRADAELLQTESPF